MKLPEAWDAAYVTSVTAEPYCKFWYRYLSKYWVNIANTSTDTRGKQGILKKLKILEQQNTPFGFHVWNVNVDWPTHP